MVSEEDSPVDNFSLLPFSSYIVFRVKHCAEWLTFQMHQELIISILEVVVWVLNLLQDLDFGRGGFWPIDLLVVGVMWGLLVVTAPYLARVGLLSVRMHRNEMSSLSSQHVAADLSLVPAKVVVLVFEVVDGLVRLTRA